MGGAPLQRWLGVPLALLGAITLQASLFAWIPLFGAHAEVAFVVAVVVAMLEGPEWGAGAGFVAGFFVDLLGVLPLGISALSYSVVGYGVGVLATYMPDDAGLGVGVALAAGATLLAQSLVLGLAFLLGQGTRGVTALVVVLTAVYSGILATAVIPTMRFVLAPRGARR